MCQRSSASLHASLVQVDLWWPLPALSAAALTTRWRDDIWATVRERLFRFVILPECIHGQGRLSAAINLRARLDLAGWRGVFGAAAAAPAELLGEIGNGRGLC